MRRSLLVVVALLAIAFATVPDLAWTLRTAPQINEIFTLRNRVTKLKKAYRSDADAARRVAELNPQVPPFWRQHVPPLAPGEIIPLPERSSR